MHIDRQRFLLLATTIAAGCGASDGAPTDVPVATPRELEGEVATEPMGEVPAEPDAPVAFSESADTVRFHLAKQCQRLAPPSGPFCEGFDETAEMCPRFAELLRPSAARRAVACLEGRSGTMAICGYRTVEDCFLAGVSASTSTRQSGELCRDVMARCGSSRWRGDELNDTTCRRAIGAVRESDAKQLAACMTEGCSIKRCIYDLAN